MQSLVTHTRIPRIVNALVLLVVGMLAQSVAGATYYVSTAGNDGNPGTLSSPWQTIQHAANTATAGATVYVMGGTYKESVNFPNSGRAGAPIRFESYPGQTALISGSGLSCCTSNPASSGNETQGLVNIVDGSYIIISGFAIGNFTTSNAAPTPAGIWITGSGTDVQILNNQVYNITTTAQANGNAFGIAVYGTSTTPITQLVISGNQVYNLKTGESESVNTDGNVTHFKITNNIVHDNDNIGIAAIGDEGVGPPGYDVSSYGEISGNTVYNISAIVNPGEGSSYDADGVYCDGCAYVTIERNWIYNVDYGIEVASENQVCQANGTEWTGPNNTGTASLSTHPCYGEYVTVRNNVISNSNAAGSSIGGYAKASSKGGHDEGGGSTYDAVFVNNTLYNNAKEPAGATAEYQIQNQVGGAQHNYFENNLVYAGTFNTWIYSFVPSSTSYPAPPATLDWNLYYSAAGYVQGTSIFWNNVSKYTSFANYQSTTGEDESSRNSNPDFESLTSNPLNFDIPATSPAVNNGGTNLSCSIGWCDPDGGSPNSIYGATDFLGRTRMTNGAINIGAYQVKGIASNTLTVKLTSGSSTLQPRGSTTLKATVTATPAGGGAPSGTVQFMLGTKLLSTQTLLPTGVNTTSASMPLSASELATEGAYTLTAVYSGNTIGTNCCTATHPPGGATQVAIYPSTTSAPITVSLQ
jgi:Right handed beta helix region